jgi:prepilin-type processing-associated H-X9-DG protein
VVAVAAALAAAGAWAWRLRASPSVDPLALGSAAYRRGDWASAASFARDRLKASKDDREALALLARATARLGRDQSAMALFNRLGPESLRAEDLYLLGVVLRREGKAGPALRVWERAVRADARHAEALEALAAGYSAVNRLVEASGLAERLSRVPGCEARGGLALGALRAELNDPAGAAAALGPALAAARLAPADLAPYRRLLARSLSQTGRAGEARGALETVLAVGPDAEASWLLSRCLLQQGDPAGAADAPARAGAYRADNPLQLEPAPYVGSARCAVCHGEINRNQVASRHAATLLRGGQLDALPLPERPVPDPADPKVTHTFSRDGRRVRFETRVGDRVFGSLVEFAFGARDRYLSLVGRDGDGNDRTLRLSYHHLPGGSGWDRTTGHAAAVGRDDGYLGKPLDAADGLYRCLFCHATNPRAALEQSGPESQDRGIGCERCHGPGGNHLKAVAAKFSDPAIVRPALAPAEGRVRLCGQCHSEHVEPDLPRTDPFWVRFQGQQGHGWDCSPIPMTYSSYAGNLGPLLYYPGLGCGPGFPLSQMQGVFAHIGGIAGDGDASISPVSISMITDGTSNTMMYGEHAHSRIAANSPTGDYFGINWWTSGDFGDTTYSTLFPPNFFVSDDASLLSGIPKLVPRQSNFSDTATSMHPGGCNFAFCDGSVRFIKNTVSSWNPRAITYANPNYNLNGQRYGVYQALSTRSGGEVISADAF